MCLAGRGFGVAIEGLDRCAGVGLWGGVLAAHRTPGGLPVLPRTVSSGRTNTCAAVVLR